MFYVAIFSKLNVCVCIIHVLYMRIIVCTIRGQTDCIMEITLVTAKNILNKKDSKCKLRYETKLSVLSKCPTTCRVLI